MPPPQNEKNNACTGVALDTVKAHAAPADITLFGCWFCPFVQRTWTALEHFNIPYHYHEVNPYKKPKDLLEVSPKGLVPALRFNDADAPKALNESLIILEYLEELNALKDPSGKNSLLPPPTDPYARALARLQADYALTAFNPAFQRYMQAQTEEDQITHGKAFIDALQKLAELFDKHKIQPGLWAGDRLGWADVIVAPWLLRMTNSLTYYRGFALPPSTKFKAYLERVLTHPAFRRTCSTEDVYVGFYEHFTDSRPKTGAVTAAITAGRTLP